MKLTWARLGQAARVYRTLVSASLRGQMQYRLDFLGSTLIQAVMGADGLIFVGAILWRFGPIAGWSILDIGMLFAVSRIGMGIYMLLCNELDKFEVYMVNGDFDTLMIRPWPTLFTLLARGTGIHRLAFLVQGIAAGAVVLPKLAAQGGNRGMGLGMASGFGGLDRDAPLCGGACHGCGGVLDYQDRGAPGVHDACAGYCCHVSA